MPEATLRRDRAPRRDRAQSIEEKQEEFTRRQRHCEEIRDQLQRERTRILDHLLPRRFALAGDAQVFPVAVETRLTEPRG